MQIRDPLDYLPLWGVYVATVAVVLLSFEVGFRLERYRLRRSEQEKEKEKEQPVGAMVGATLGLLGFMLAFTFGLAASQYYHRRDLVLAEANAIGTTYLRAEMLTEPHRTEIRNLLREYVDVRVSIQQENLNQVIHRSEELHRRLWSQAVAEVKKNPTFFIAGLFIGSLNEVIDLHGERLEAGLRRRIPGIIWFVLYFITVLAMAAIGYHAGLTGTRRSLSILAVVLTFSAVISLIADLDRSAEGLLKVSQQAMVDLRNTIIAPES